MAQKLVTGDCMNCESGFELQYETEIVSAEYPQFCPFCGEVIEDVSEEYIEDDDDTYGDDEDWEK